MKIYELMRELAELPAGQEVEVGLCLSREEFEQGDEVKKNVFAFHFKVVDICDGTIEVET